MEIIARARKWFVMSKFIKKEADIKSVKILLVKARQITAAATDVNKLLLTKINSKLRKLNENDDNLKYF